MEASSFQRFGGYCAIAAGIGTFAYSVAFVIIARSAPDLGANISWGLLMVGGLLSSVFVVALSQRLRDVEPGFALWGMLLGVVASLGSSIHGGYELANAINPPASHPALPSQVDPRGLLTFGIWGLAVLVFSWLMGRHPRFDKRLSYLGFVSAALLLLIYLARLIVLTSTSLVVLVPAALSGFVVGPVFSIWLGTVLLKNGIRER
ncbi:MAG TPA: hypothetical protein VN863_04485 [Candidatus Dormibacteraeota bacterium]|nr:hypothetical protein [Candidatus Dormibacteraeota bacterium]